LGKEALITGWQTLRTWITERREKEKTQRRLEEKAEEWTRLGKSGGLLDEVALAEAEQWLTSPDAADLGYSADLVELIRSSRSALEKARKKLRNRFVYASILAAVAAVVAGIALFFWNLSAEQTRMAQESYERSEKQGRLAQARQLAAQSELERGQNGESLIRSTLLAVESMGRQRTREGDLALRRGLELLRQELACLSHENAVSAVKFSSSGQVLATASWDGTARL
jgi:hypothetical protein